jgi:hypothetical protein
MKSELLTLEKRSRELESLAREIGECENCGAPIKRPLKRHDRLRE